VNAPVDVLAVMDRAAFDAAPESCGEMAEARAAVAELMACSRATVRAFEALGEAEGVIANLEAFWECEQALIEQKAALARIGGAG
jgi:hypothetical protein